MRKVKKYSLVLVGHHIFSDDDITPIRDGALFNLEGTRNFTNHNVEYEIGRFETVNQAKEKYFKRKDETGKKFWKDKDGFALQYKNIINLYQDTKQKYTLKDFKDLMRYRCSKCGEEMTEVGYRRRYNGRTDCYDCGAKNSITKVNKGKL
jgi:formylmethanofuran dehydrogenase subunit E